MRDRKRRTLVYKLAEFGPPGVSLSARLHAALSAKPTVGTRKEQLAPEGEGFIWRLIGDFSVSDNFVYGVLMRYMPGLHPSCVVEDDDAATVTVNQLAVPATDDGRRQELVECTLYFACIDNHVVMMQSSGLRGHHLELHLKWLLTHAGQMDDRTTLRLRDQPRLDTVRLLEENDVKALEIHGDITPDEEFDAEETETVREDFDVDEGPGRKVWELIKSCLGEDQAARLPQEELEEANLHFTLNVRYTKKSNESGREVMNRLGNAFRHSPVGTSIVLANGQTIRGADLKLAGKLNIDTYDGVPSTVEVWEGLRTWLLEQLRQGALPAA